MSLSEKNKSTKERYYQQQRHFKEAQEAKGVTEASSRFNQVSRKKPSFFDGFCCRTATIKEKRETKMSCQQ